MAQRTGPKPQHWTELFIPEPNSGCWLWIGQLTHGRASLIRRIDGKRTNMSVSRMVWQETNGDIPTDKWVLHRCDMGACVNPEHLYLGTHKDNMRDMAAHGKLKRPRKTHCPRGHRYTRYSYPYQNTFQVCLVCNREKCKAYYVRTRERLQTEAVK